VRRVVCLFTHQLLLVLISLTDGGNAQAELIWAPWFAPRWFICPKMVTHPCTNRARCRVTTLIETVRDERAVTSFLPEPLEDMAVWTDTGVTLTSFSGCTSFRFCRCDFSNSVKCPCNVTHDSVILIFTFLIIIMRYYQTNQWSSRCDDVVLSTVCFLHVPHIWTINVNLVELHL